MFVFENKEKFTLSYVNIQKIYLPLSRSVRIGIIMISFKVGGVLYLRNRNTDVTANAIVHTGLLERVPTY